MSRKQTPTKQMLRNLLAEKDAYARKIDHILNSITDAFLLIDPQWNILNNNRRVELYFSLKKGELLHKNLLHLDPQFFQTDFYKYLSRALKYRKKTTFEAVYPSLNRWFSVNAFPVQEGLAIYFTEITKRKDIEKHLRENEEHFRTVVEHAEDTISVTNMEGSIMYVSPSCKKVTGYYPQELIGHNVIDYIHPDDIAIIQKSIRYAISKKKPTTMIVRMKHKEGYWISIERVATVILDEYKKPKKIVTVSRDVTKRLALERRKDEFISMASHELKTPITTIKAFTQILKRQFEKKNDVIISTYLSKMEVQIDKLTSLIVNMLEVSRAQQGRLQFHFSEFQLNDLLQNTLEDIQDTITTHTILLQGDFNKLVYGDKDRLGQVLINLINNAVKYSPKANKILISIATHSMKKQREQDACTINVTDYGIGIPERHQKRIFEKFYRVEDNNQRTHYPGLGVGLYISSEIITKHGGRMWVKSTIGKGSTFSFSLPLKKK